MGTTTLFFIALGLSMDAFAVSISNGMCYQNFGRRQAVACSFAFGLFQMLMPIAGYFAGRSFSDIIQSADHWVALILLAAIGGIAALVLYIRRSPVMQSTDAPRSLLTAGERGSAVLFQSPVMLISVIVFILLTAVSTFM